MVKRSWRSLGLRMSAWYAVGLIGSFAIIGFFARWIIVEGDRAEDREEVMGDFTEKAEWLRRVGFNHFRDEILRKAPDPDSTLVRLSEKDGTTVLLQPPELESPAEIESIGRLANVGRVRGWQRASTHDGSGVWQIYGEPMPDGHWLQVGRSDHHSREGEQRFQRTLLPVGGVVVLLALLGGLGLTARALAPIRRLIDTTRGVINSGDMTARVPTREAGGTELDELNELFNEMLAKNEGLIRGMREALDNVAHDLRTPLTRLRSAAESVLRDRDSSAEARGEALSDAIDESDRVLATLQALTDISEAEHGVMQLHRESIDVGKLLSTAAALYEYVADARGIVVKEDSPSDLYVRADLVRLQQVIANLLDNAVKYSPAGGEIVLGAGCHQQKGGEVWLSVTDSGIGIPEHDLPRIWDRLYRGDQSRSEKGSGLGLSLVKAVVEAHGGIVEAKSELRRGSSFRIILPASCIGCT